MQQPHETARLYSYFKLYLELGPKRTFTMLADEIGIRAEIFSGYAARWRWNERIERHRKHLDKVAQQEAERVSKEMGRRQARLGGLLQAKAEEALNLLLYDSDENRPSANDVAKLAEVGAKIERAAVGERVTQSPAITIVLPVIPTWAKGSKFVVQAHPKPQLDDGNTQDAEFVDMPNADTEAPGGSTP